MGWLTVNYNIEVEFYENAWTTIFSFKFPDFNQI